MIFKPNTKKILKYFFQFPHLKTFYKSGMLDFQSIVNIYENIIKKQEQCELFGKTFYGLLPVNYYTLDEIFTSNVYEFNSENDNPLIIDCGANIGLSILFFKQQYPDAIIYAFEPDTTNYNYLKKNIISYKWENSVFPFQKLVDNENGFEFFEELGNAGSKISNSEKGVKIEKMRLLDFIKNLGKEIDFLKIDIEGSEFEVIPDLKEVFPKIRKMYIEFHCEENDFSKMYEYIKLYLGENFNFQISTNFTEDQNIYDSLKTKNSKTYYNCFAVNKNT